MKKHSIILFLSVFVAVGFSFGRVVPKFPPTSLKVIVLDEMGNPVQDAEVSLFGNQEDYKAETNPLAQKTTNKKGQAVFKQLDPAQYFVLASFAGKTNIGLGVQTGVLFEGRVNKVNTIIR